MTYARLIDDLLGQRYPLSISEETATALLAYINAIWACVSDDDRMIVGPHYSHLTAALVHPTSP